MDLVDQLVELYKQEFWHSYRLTDEEARSYYECALKKGIIITYIEGGQLLAYGEFYRLSFEHFGRIICGEKFHIAEEDVNHGPIAYVSSVFILPKYRCKGIIQYLRNRFFWENHDAEYFVGEALRKKHQPVKVFKNQEFFHKYIKTEGEVIPHGKD